MIITVNFEEMLALRVGARAVLEDGVARAVAVAMPPEDRASVAALPPLNGDLSVGTLSELLSLESGVEAIMAALRSEMDERIVETHPASESAVASYFDYAHALAVLGRIRETRAEMEALIELVTGQPADEDLARTFAFPD
jgi:hypothetical protein